MIAPELEPFAVDVDSLTELQGNPRRGDVEAVKRSYAAFMSAEADKGATPWLRARGDRRQPPAQSSA